MPKRNYELAFGKTKYNSKKEKVEENVEEEPEMVDMDFFGMGESVSVRDNHIYFYGNVTTKNAVKLNTAIRDITKKLINVQTDYGVDNLKIYLHINSFGGSVFGLLS